MENSISRKPWMKSLDELIDIKKTVKKELFDKPGVIGVGVGYKEVRRKVTKDPAIRVYVKKKRSDLPKNWSIPSEIDGALTDIIEEPEEVIAYSNPSTTGGQTSQGMLVGGAEIGPSRRFADNGRNSGTIGYIIGDQNEPMILSSYHVLAVDNNWNNERNKLISQPAGDDQNIVAVVEEAWLDGNVDAAVARITDENKRRARTGILPNIPQVNGAATRDDVVQMVQSGNKSVRKSGKVTKLTSGIIGGIEDLDFSIDVKYTYSPIHRFENQIRVVPRPGTSAFSVPGDSGSLVIDDSNRAIGLLVAGAGSFSVVNYFQDIQQYLGIQI
jgi:hypothetical protein